MIIKPINSITAIVLIGNFNPRIFIPSWFSKNGVIGEEEGENAEIELVHKELVKFSLNWITVLVEKGRFIAEITQPPEIRLYDFVYKTFGELLVHTPIWAMGINKRIDFNAGSTENRDKIGYTLAPPEAWGEWAEDIRKEKEPTHGGMISLSMRQTAVDDRPSGYIQSRVEPSELISTGVFVEVNDHYNLPQAENVEGSHEIIRILSDNFEKSIKRSEWIVDQIMRLVR